MSNNQRYNGHKNYNFWNISLWLHNDYYLYEMAKDHVSNCSGPKSKAAQNILDELVYSGRTHTPDGVKWTKSGILAAISDIGN